MSKLLVVLMLLLTGCNSLAPPRELLATSIKSFDGFTLYDNIIIEVLPSKEHTPTLAFQRKFKSQLDKYKICHAKNVYFVIRKIPKKIPTKWTYDKILSYERKYRILYDIDPQDRNLILFVANLPGRSVELDRPNLAGLQYSKSSFIYFYQGKNTLSTWIHELGHVIGLVNRKWRKERPVNLKRPKHCNDEQCYMYWMVGGTHFDKKCRVDIVWMIFLDHLKRSKSKSYFHFFPSRGSRLKLLNSSSK